MRIRSLSTRLMVVTIIWTSIALLLTGLLLSTLFRQNAQRSFEEQLVAHTYNLIGAIEIDDSGRMIGEPNLGDPRFLQPGSGWYWSVSKAADSQVPLIYSPSITNEPLAQMPVAKVPFNDQFRRIYSIAETSGTQVVRVEAQLFVGEDDTVFQVLVAGNSEDIDLAVADFRYSLWTFFGIFGLGTLAATYFVIWYGLKPLNEATDALVDVREGESEKLKGEFPNEIKPLAQEINALIETNKSITERARMQVGNLAHALKTPLAVILNEARSPADQTNEKIIEQAGLMQLQIRNYLDRARIAAQKKTIVSRTPVAPTINKLLSVMRKLSPELEFTFTSGAEDLSFAGEEQDLQEVLGNLLENASKFALRGVQIEAAAVNDQLNITIEDDGPGLSPEEFALAIERGKRLDETQPGSGLGLSIVNTIAEEYGGDLELGKSELGGLKAVVILPTIGYT